MENIIYHNDVIYRKVKSNEEIKYGAIHRIIPNGNLFNIMGGMSTIGNCPKSFSKDREFFNPDLVIGLKKFLLVHDIFEKFCNNLEKLYHSLNLDVIDCGLSAFEIYEKECKKDKRPKGDFIGAFTWDYEFKLWNKYNNMWEMYCDNSEKLRIESDIYKTAGLMNK